LIFLEGLDNLTLVKFAVSHCDSLNLKLVNSNL